MPHGDGRNDRCALGLLLVVIFIIVVVVVVVVVAVTRFFARPGSPRMSVPSVPSFGSPATPMTSPKLGVYFESWAMPWPSPWPPTPAKLELAQLPSSLNLVYIAFANPQCAYRRGDNAFDGTGLNFGVSFALVKGAIAILRARGVTVMLSVGGATYPWDVYNANGIAALASDLGCDGIDIDWEPAAGYGAADQLAPIIQSVRAAFPRIGSSGGFLSLAGFSVGAFDHVPAWQNSGMCIAGLQQSGALLDWINIMSYDAGVTYSPTDAFDAYRTHFAGPLLVGCEVPPEAWGGHVITLEEVNAYARHAKADGPDNGLFVWSYYKTPSPASAPGWQAIIDEAGAVFAPPSRDPPSSVPARPPKPRPQLSSESLPPQVSATSIRTRPPKNANAGAPRGVASRESR